MVYGAYESLDAPLTALLDRQQARAFTRLLETIPHAADPRDPAALAADAVGRMSAMLREKPDTWRLILLTPGTSPRSSATASSPTANAAGSGSSEGSPSP
ncbi:hypothetical protein ACFU6M_19950 [Streptomyces bottropensis]|uniref:hypothetical protein n=1 Tax=Streptomyces bottropensis TaxID=42235 RepID=UPI0036907F75